MKYRELRVRTLLSGGALLAALTGCGAVHVGNNTTDPIPSGTLLVSGPFSGQVSGSASVYSQGGGNYVLRLNSFSSPSVSNLQAVVTANGSTVATITLLYTTGSRNYGFAATSGLTFQLVTIHSPVTVTDYGTATLQ